MMDGSLYPPEVEGRITELLSPKEGVEARQASVLDLGCGSGIWLASPRRRSKMIVAELSIGLLKWLKSFRIPRFLDLT